MMKVDNELLKEVKRANGDGTREAKFALLNKIRNCKRELEDRKSFNYFSSESFSMIFKKYDRAIVAILLASTIYHRQEDLEKQSLLWALEILNQWTTRGRSVDVIDDGLHSTRIEQYAGAFMKLTTVAN